MACDGLVVGAGHRCGSASRLVRDGNGALSMADRRDAIPDKEYRMLSQLWQPAEGPRFTLGTAATRYQQRWHQQEFETIDRLRSIGDAAGISMATMAVYTTYHGSGVGRNWDIDGLSI